MFPENNSNGVSQRGTIRRLLLCLWFPRFYLIVATLLLLALAIIFSVRNYLLSQAEKDLADVIAETEETDPRWRWDQIQEDREVIPDDENAALCVLRVKDLLAKVPRLDLGTPDPFADLPPNQVLSKDLEDKLRSYLQNAASARHEARRLTNLPRGRYTVHWSRPILSKTSLEDLQKARSASNLLMYDAYLAAQDRDMDQALNSCLAVINAGRSIGDEPALIPLLIRISCASLGVTTAQRVLAQGECSVAALTSLQSLLEDEVAQPLVYRAVRGDRAMEFEMLQEIRRCGGTLDDLDERRGSIFEPIQLVRAQEEWLRWMTRLVEACKQPCVTQEAEFRKIANQVDARARSSRSLIFTAGRIPSTATVAKSVRRYLARLHCAVTALALERYRLENGAWPQSLDALVPKYLNEMPQDPFGTGALQIKSLPNGLVIHSALKLAEDEKALGLEVAPDQPTVLGFRLWNPDKRRQPAESKQDPKSP